MIQLAACCMPVLRWTGCAEMQCKAMPCGSQGGPLMHACVVQEHAYDHEAVDWLMENCPTVVQMFEGLCKVYADRTMFGFCDPGSDQWQTITYKQFHERVVQFSAGVLAAPVVPRSLTEASSGMQGTRSSCPDAKPLSIIVSGGACLPLCGEA